MESVRFDDFFSKLRFALAASQGTLTIALRVDGHDTEANVLLRTPNLHERLLLVRAAQSRRRADTWNLVGRITDVVMRNKPPLNNPTPLPDTIHDVFEKGINHRKSGWVVLEVDQWRPMSARLAAHP